VFNKRLYYSDGKKVTSFGLFIVPVAILFVFLLPLGIKNHPILVAAAFVSLAITVILSSLGFLYVGLRIDRYVQKHDFQLWKKSKSPSFKDRREAGKAMNAMSMQTPYLEKYVKYANRIAFTLLTIWTLMFLGIFSFIVFSAI